jgi:hypothetical protein
LLLGHWGSWQGQRAWSLLDWERRVLGVVRDGELVAHDAGCWLSVVGVSRDEDLQETVSSFYGLGSRMELITHRVSNLYVYDGEEYYISR